MSKTQGKDNDHILNRDMVKDFNSIPDVALEELVCRSVKDARKIISSGDINVFNLAEFLYKAYVLGVVLEKSGSLKDEKNKPSKEIISEVTQLKLVH